MSIANEASEVCKVLCRNYLRGEAGKSIVISQGVLNFLDGEVE